jgi:hypothetical protein
MRCLDGVDIRVRLEAPRELARGRDLARHAQMQRAQAAQ